MNPQATITDEAFQAYLLQIRALAEGPFEEMQPEIEVSNRFPQRFYDLARDNDLYRFYLPAEYGGWGLNELEILRVQEEFSRGPGGMRMHLHHAADMNWRILDDYGCPALKARYMDKFQDKSIYCNFAITEQTGGTGADIHTTAVKDADGNYVLNGEKWLISHTDCSDFTYVIAATDPDSDKDSRLSAFFVPTDAPGFELVPMPHMMGCRGAGHAGLKFDNVVLSPEHLLGEEGQGMEIAMHSLSVSRVHIACSNLGMAQRMLEISLARAEDRVTFGKPIASRQMIKREIAEMQTYVHALRTLVHDFARDFDDDPHGADIEEKAAIAKLFSIYTTRIVSDAMLEIFGGDGYFEDNPYGPVERLYRDARAMWLEEGAPNVQRITIARACQQRKGELSYRY
ncbi:acyl-CoA/acyl-ACP dehydrogenase [Eggerthella guodeyinii]|uniref:Acyl-CoA/acyl-ACP dehydrogenase n=1 Tax=Eggerthella guodeyinii TaxID=2690837 RepID=A0A6L7IT07_9ACTN|nr:acyl-CoA dehydrogenase family protein [Eggerthella guodeyinii]QOS66988.1 acyl-CoA/acyl-ACP dehydrogenase [Eggerthella guodeyinii]